MARPMREKPYLFDMLGGMTDKHGWPVEQIFAPVCAARQQAQDGANACCLDIEAQLWYTVGAP